MPIITLPDGKNLDFSKKITGLDIAKKISKSLANQALVISVDGELKDLDFVIEKNCAVKIFTSKNEEGESSVAEETLSKVQESKTPTKEINDLPFDVDEDKPKATKKTDDVASAFDDLFNN